jgi:hypothetical protein
MYRPELQRGIFVNLASFPIRKSRENLKIFSLFHTRSCCFEVVFKLHFYAAERCRTINESNFGDVLRFEWLWNALLTPALRCSRSVRPWIETALVSITWWIYQCSVWPLEYGTEMCIALSAMRMREIWHSLHIPFFVKKITQEKR